MYENFKSVVKLRGLTIEKFCLAYGITYGHMKQVMQGRLKPTWEEANAIRLFLLVPESPAAP